MNGDVEEWGRAVGVLAVMIVAIGIPVGVWILWRVQRIAVGILRLSMVKMARNNRKLYLIASWLGTFLHELSHAIFLLLSGLGIKGFSVRAETGHVEPRRLPKNSIQAVGFIVAAMAPMFFVPALVLIGAWLALDEKLLYWSAPGLGAGVLESFGLLVWFPVELGVALVAMDVLHWPHAVLFLLVLFGAPGTRPSHVKQRGERSSGDIGVVRAQLRRRPWLIGLAPLMLLVGFFVVVPIWPPLFWVPLQAIWYAGATGVVIALVGAVIWWTVARTARIATWAAWLPAVIVLVLQITPRLVGADDLAPWNLATLALAAAAATMLSFAAPKRDAIDRAIRG